MFGGEGDDSEDGSFDKALYLPKDEDKDVDVVVANTFCIGSTGSGKSECVRLLRAALGKGPEYNADEPACSHGKDKMAPDEDLEGCEVWGEIGHMARKVRVVRSVDSMTFAKLRGAFGMACSGEGAEFPLKAGVPFAFDEPNTLPKDFSGVVEERVRDVMLNEMERLAVKVKYLNVQSLKGRISMSAAIAAKPYLVAMHNRQFLESGFMGKCFFVPLPPASSVDECRQDNGKYKAAEEVTEMMVRTFGIATKAREKARSSGGEAEVVVTRSASRRMHRYCLDT